MGLAAEPHLRPPVGSADGSGGGTPPVSGADDDRSGGRAPPRVVWRRSLDFGAIDEIRRLTHRIRDEQRGPGSPEPGYNLKLGRGGIREVRGRLREIQLR